MSDIATAGPGGFYEADEAPATVQAAFRAGTKHTTTQPPADLLAKTAADMRAVAAAATLGSAPEWVQDGATVTRPDGKLWGDMRGPAVAAHAAAWDPTMADTFAAFLTAIATEYARWPVADQLRFQASDPGLFAVVRTWWARRPPADGRPSA